jgi:hypothetical protein
MPQLILLFFPLPFLGFWIWMLRDMSNNPYLSDEERRWWNLAFIFANIIAAGLYYFTIYRKR